MRDEMMDLLSPRGRSGCSTKAVEMPEEIRCRHHVDSQECLNRLARHGVMHFGAACLVRNTRATSVFVTVPVLRHGVLMPHPLPKDVEEVMKEVARILAETTSLSFVGKVSADDGLLFEAEMAITLSEGTPLLESMVRVTSGEYAAVSACEYGLT